MLVHLCTKNQVRMVDRCMACGFSMLLRGIINSALWLSGRFYNLFRVRGQRARQCSGSSVVDLISDRATVELISCTPASLLSWSKKKRS